MAVNLTKSRRVAKGLCPDCGEAPEPGRKSCKSCGARNCEKQRRLAERKELASLCHCGAARKEGSKQCQECLTKRNVLFRKRREAGLCEKCSDPVPDGQSKCVPCRTKNNARQRDLCRRIKAEVFAHYGARCECCGETTFEFLSIDHIGGGGTRHREEINKTKHGGSIFMWLKYHGFPVGYRTLCFNCNCARGFSGECPHERLSQLELCGPRW